MQARNPLEASLESPAELGRLLAASPAMRDVLERVRRAAAADASVIVQGETGTGKELVAEAIHDASSRAAGPYVVVDCASVARELIESELFGHAKGAFTGALESRKGAFESASGGTVFIDEIGELPLDLQPRLLRVLERREVKPVGTNELRSFDCRVVCATNRDLRREVEAGRFREDLFFRLAVIELELPPLRERPEDIELLSRRFLEQVAFMGPIAIEPATLERLKAHAWPGNVRELRNTIERAAALSDRTLRLPDDFGADVDLHDPAGLEPGAGVGLGEQAFEPPAATPGVEAGGSPPAAPGEITRPLWAGRNFKAAKAAVLEDFERGYVTDLLARHGHNVSSAAREAGIHRNILHRMIAKHDL
jgi:DNA-binding NtrC family response regulator